MNILLKTIQAWWCDDPFTDSAAISYYAIFSIPGLLVIILSMAALFFDSNLMEKEIFDGMNNILGPDIAQNLENIVQQTSIGNRDIWAMIVGLGTLFFGATGLFMQLQRSLNAIWSVGVKKKKRYTPKFIKDRLVSFGMIVVIGFLLLVSMTVTAVISLFSDWISNQISASFLFLLSGLDLAISVLLVSVLFMAIFKVLPDTKVKWSYALQGGILSAVLFHIGEYALNLYFSLVEPASTFGAAGSIILLMIWVFYSAMILLVGAEYTKQAQNNEEL